MLFFFFFQAEDGIRDHCVTGVQTCALPISSPRSGAGIPRTDRRREGSLEGARFGPRLSSSPWGFLYKKPEWSSGSPGRLTMHAPARKMRSSIGRTEATIMRGIRSTWLTTLVVTTVVGTLGLGATARAGTARPVNRGYQHLLQVEAARDAAMAARGARPGSALPTHGGVAGPATLGTVRDVEQISEDTLHQGEKDTQ